MVNNQLKVAQQLRHLIFTSLLLLNISVVGQNISKYYTSSIQQNGTLFFIFPQSGFENSKIKAKLTYDITYLTKNDSAVLIFSFFDKTLREIDSIVFISVNKKYTSAVKKIFVEPKKQKWHFRYNSKFQFNELDEIFNSVSKPRIILYTKQGEVELDIKAKKWKKHSSITNKIFTLIKYNK